MDTPFKMVQVLPPAADRYNANPSTDIVSLENFERVVFVIGAGAGDTGTATITLNAASDNSGTGAEAIPFFYRTGAADAVSQNWTQATAAGFTTAAAADGLHLVMIDAGHLPETKPWVFLTLTEVANDPVLAGAWALFFEPRARLDTAVLT